MNNIVLISIPIDELKNLIKDAVHQEFSQKKEKEILNFKQTYELLQISPSTLNQWKAENKIPFKKLGKRVFFSRSDVLAALKESNYQKLKI